MNKSLSAVKVLVVDDEPLIVEELCEFLENRGYQCVPCESGKQAVDKFCDDHDIGLVLGEEQEGDSGGDLEKGDRIAGIGALAAAAGARPGPARSATGSWR